MLAIDDNTQENGEYCQCCGALITPETHPEAVVGRYAYTVFCNARCERNYLEKFK